MTHLGSPPLNFSKEDHEIFSNFNQIPLIGASRSLDGLYFIGIGVFEQVDTLNCCNNLTKAIRT